MVQYSKVREKQLAKKEGPGLFFWGGGGGGGFERLLSVTTKGEDVQGSVDRTLRRGRGFG